MVEVVPEVMVILLMAEHQVQETKIQQPIYSQVLLFIVEVIMVEVKAHQKEEVAVEVQENKDNRVHLLFPEKAEMDFQEYLKLILTLKQILVILVN